MEIGIIGAGISGLSLEKLVKDFGNVEILEKNNYVGGIARPKIIKGVPYHTIGGHCFNSKNQEIIDFAFNFLPESEWHTIPRNAKVEFRGNRINYPIEFSINQISNIDGDLAFKMIEDLFKSKRGNTSNLRDWFIYQFGETLAEEYFIPYNEKIWKRDLEKMSPTWILDKLPTPTKKEIILSLTKNLQDDMPHKVFYYPNSNTQETFIDSLAKDAKITLNYEAFKIENQKGKWVVNGEKKYDVLISTMPLKFLPRMIKNAPNSVVKAAEGLKYNTVTNMIFEADSTDEGWTYFPSRDTFIHKQAHMGNFTLPKSRGHSTIESIGRHTEEEMLKEAEKFSNLKTPLAYSSLEYPAYVVYDESYSENRNKIKKYISFLTNFHTLGRFGEWEYYNMDKCMESAMNLSEKIKSKSDV